MTEIYDKIVSNRGNLRNLADKIPGFRGYLDSGDRRTADRMLRDHVANLMDQSIARFARLESKILDNGGLAMMSETREVKAKMQGYRDRVKTAEPGYAGLWPKIKIDSEELDKLYAFDEAQIHYVNRIDEMVTRVDQALDGNDDLEEALTAVSDATDEAAEAYALRDNVIMDLAK